MAVHLRRRDFIIGHKASIPTINDAAFQLRENMDELGLTVLFVATDGETHGTFILFYQFNYSTNSLFFLHLYKLRIILYDIYYIFIIY